LATKRLKKAFFRFSGRGNQWICLPLENVKPVIDNEDEIIDYGNDDCWRHVQLHGAKWREP
jgi:hypothetical protein